MLTKQKGDVVLEIKDLTKCFQINKTQVLTACDKINLTAYNAETLGIVGESGCGKSTLMRVLTKIHEATSGEIFFENQDILKLKGEDSRQLRKKIQMVFQNPASAFNPKMRIKDIICEPLLNFGLIKKSEIEAKAIEMLRLVELPADFINRFPHSMSGGQQQRVGIARALTLKPEIIICDEATSALDVSVQAKVCKLLAKIQKETGVSILFICHDLALVEQISHKIAVMYLGNIVELLNSSDLKNQVKHPYTEALLESVFKTNFEPGEKIKTISSNIPSALDLPSGCPFHTRCEHTLEICSKIKPKLKEVSPNHFVACHLY